MFMLFDAIEKLFRNLVVLGTSLGFPPVYEYYINYMHAAVSCLVNKIQGYLLVWWYLVYKYLNANI